MDHLQLTREIPVDEAYARFAEDDDDTGTAFSIASTKYNFHWENGRLYQDYHSRTPFPYNDDMSEENEQVLHSMVLYLLEDSLVAAPVTPQNLRNVLDLGTGMGLWAEDVADRYDKCQVIGVDTLPHDTSVLPNLQFLDFNVVDEWIFDKSDIKFDFIHIRSLFASLRRDDWPQLYQQCIQ
jgi:Methyltransferase domain